VIEFHLMLIISLSRLAGSNDSNIDAIHGKSIVETSYLMSLTEALR